MNTVAGELLNLLDIERLEVDLFRGTGAGGETTTRIFGGQVIAHATHQFFLRSGCLYVLVMDSRAEINATEQAQYWLEHVKAFAGEAPVILVGIKRTR